MKTARKALGAAAVGIVLVAFTLPVNAQNSGRTAAIERCMAKAHAQYPRTQRAAGGSSRARTAIYTACMQAAGFPP